MQNTMKKFIKFSFLAITLMVGFSLMNALQVQALTIANQNGIPSACPDKYPNNTGNCTVFIDSITVNGFIDNDTSYTARTTSVPYGYLVSGQTITIGWADNSGSNVNNYIVKYGCGNSIDLSNDDYTISYPMWPKSTTWTVPNNVSNYQYCKIWVYTKGAPNSQYPIYGPTLGVSNTRAFTIQSPITYYLCNQNTWQCVVDSSGSYISSSTCQNNCIAPTRYSCNTSTYQCYQATFGTYVSFTDCQTACQPPLTRYTCNANYQCVVASNGEYTSLSTCQNNCQAPIRYSCNTNTYQCYSDPFGSYTSLNNCTTNCQLPTTRYSCNTSTYQCYQAVFGTYGSYNDCVSACQPPLIKYTCNASYQCVVDSNGQYTSLTSCQNDCVVPVRYSCNSNTYQCYSDPLGGYTTLNSCTTNCQLPLVRYSCNTSTYQCYQAVFGNYTSYNDCQTACQPPSARYTCNANYQCVVASNGEYTSLSTCQNSCIAPTRYSCNTSTYQCYQAVFGTYGSYNDCVSACQQIIQPLSVSCYASPSYGQVNQTVTFYSNVSGGSGNYTYYWSGYASGNGSYSQQTFGSSGTYSANLMVYDSNSRTGSASCSINIQGQSILTPTLSFWADDYTLSQGDSTYLRWTSNNANYCVASNGWSGTQSLSGYQTTTPPSQTTYTLTCYGSNGGQVFQSLTLYVASPTTIINFTKLGRNLSNGDRVYSKVIRVAQGDIIEFYLTVTAGSANDLSNVVITDNLPSVFSYQSGTTKVNNITQADGITTTGLSLGTISRGTSKTVTFQALSNNPGTYFTYTNTAQVTASGISAISDNATITFSSVLGAATVETGAEDSLWISLIISIGLAFLVWYYIKFNPQGKLVLAKVENKIRDINLVSLRKKMLRK